MLVVSWGMGHGVNIALGKIGYASPVKWDNASLPYSALHQPNASLHSPPLSLTLHWTLLAAFSPLPWIEPSTLRCSEVGSMQWQCVSEFTLHSRFYQAGAWGQPEYQQSKVWCVYTSEYSRFYKPALTYLARVNPVLTRRSQPMRMRCFININTSTSTKGENFF